MPWASVTWKENGQTVFLQLPIDLLVLADPDAGFIGVLQRVQVKRTAVIGIVCEPRCMAVVETLDYVIAATHLDHKSSVARFQQAEYISKWFAQRYSDTTKPVFLCGDMNDFPESDTIRRLLEDWTIVSAIEPTYPSTNTKKCIDYIFCLRNSADVETVSSNVVSACADFRMDLLSDHLPVVVEVICK